MFNYQFLFTSQAHFDQVKNHWLYERIRRIMRNDTYGTKWYLQENLNYIAKQFNDNSESSPSGMSVTFQTDNIEFAIRIVEGNVPLVNINS